MRNANRNGNACKTDPHRCVYACERLTPQHDGLCLRVPVVPVLCSSRERSNFSRVRPALTARVVRWRSARFGLCAACTSSRRTEYVLDVKHVRAVVITVMIGCSQNWWPPTLPRDCCRSITRKRKPVSSCARAATRRTRGRKSPRVTDYVLF